MNDKCVVSNRFDGHLFEKLSASEAIGGNSFLYAVDGVEVDKEVWTQKQEAAIGRDLENLHIGKNK
ncbi:MAG: hypothetical protein EOP06_32520 [Proteobacteria bacterium]|nr:MAG: hypothetical protein EOP06_32520 [Pseudomonadota bacterium]